MKAHSADSQAHVFLEASGAAAALRATRIVDARSPQVLRRVALEADAAAFHRRRVVDLALATAAAASFPSDGHLRVHSSRSLRQ